MSKTIIGGTINADGSIQTGQGFSSKKVDTGLYEITYQSRFNSVPAIALTQNYPNWSNFESSGGSTLDNCTIVAADVSKIRIKTGDGSGKASNRNFAFMSVSKEGSETSKGIVAGNVNANGTVQSGSDYFVTKIGTGLYLVTFDTPFAVVPTVVATQNYPSWGDFSSDGGSTLDNCTVVAVKSQQVLVKTGDSGGGASDRNFGFVALDDTRSGPTRNVVSGDVNANGSLYSGEGFEIVNDDHGEYTDVYFTGTFASQPAVIATQNYPKWDDFSSDGGSVHDNTTVVASNSSKVKLKTGDSSGKASDRNHSFIAIATI